jgi:DNA polymerase III gamma/tau subunit
MKLSEQYRPRTWAEIIGQEKAISMRKRMIEKGRVAGRAFVFEGESGSGKTTTAPVLARALGIMKDGETLR